MFLFLISCCFFTSPIQNENVTLRLALVFPIGIPITVANNAIEMLSLVTDKTIKGLSKQSKKGAIFTKFLTH